LNGRRFACIWVNPQGQDDGYIIYTLRREGDVSELRAYEMYYGSAEALKGLLGYVFSHDSMVKDFVWESPWGTDLLRLLDNPRVESKVVTNMMFRVVDVLPVLQHLAADYAGPEAVIRVEDRQAPWNCGNWRVGPSFAESAGSDVSPDIEITIQRLSQAVSGYSSLSSLVEAGLAVAGRMDILPDLDKLFLPGPSYVPFMNDYF
jgi:predicted acetyltransferase